MRGVKLQHNKRTRLSETIEMPAPEFLTVPMKQHSGAPCEPVVKAGDYVYAGQIIGDSSAFVSVPVHSPVSGTVVGITEILTAGNEKIKCVRIQSDHRQILDPAIAPPVINNMEDFLKAVRDSGIVGLGGAGFPTHVKLAYKDIERVKKLYINLAECEPYITADNREVFENVNGIIDGIKLVLKYTGIPEAVVVVENNKPIGTQILSLHLSEIPNINIKVIGTKYPKGAEKILVYEAGGPVIGRGKLPADCGVLVLNVSTVAAIADYIKTGIPLIKRRLTLDGDMISSPKNIRAPLGVSARDLLTYFDIDISKIKMLIAGGAMMGTCIIDFDTPITKTTNALLCFENYYDRDKTPCIRCGRCIRACPLKLSPALIEKAYDRRDVKALIDLDVDLCMNCGCCSYVCPAKRDLSHKNQLAKAFIKNQGGRQ
jgi:electron transport complex protein RnfC